MYWYLSFLRPPPVSTPISKGSITITPQIANDLRTELLFEPTEFAYFWQRASPSLGDLEAGAELLQWNPPESTYRTAEIPLPTSARPGESWRLGLYVDNAHTPSITHYANDQPGIIGVWSEPIALVRGEPSSSGNIRGVGGLSAKDKKDSKKGKGKAKEEEGKKQGRIQREWTVGSRVLHIVEQTSFDLDKKIWDSGLGLSGWLTKYLAEEHRNRKTRSITTSLGKKEDLNVLEIGSGTGLVSIALALELSERHDEERRVCITATDLDSAISLMDENIALNGLRSTAPISVHAKVLDWDQPLPAWLSPWPDIVIAADVTYNTASFPSLLSTLRALLRPASGSRPTFLLAYKQRDLAERDLWDLLKAEGIALEKVDDIKGSSEDGWVEVWIGHAS